MKNKLSLVIFLIFSIFLNAQNSIEFKTQFLPNKKYQIENFTYSKSYMNFEGDEGSAKSSQQQETNLPMISENSVIAISETETGNEKDNKIPFITNYKKVTKTQALNGSQTTSQDTLEGSKIYGFYEDKKNTKIDSVQNNKLSSEIKAMLKNLIENTTQKIDYPDKPLKIGDTFEQSVHKEFPFEDIEKVSFMINTKYLLKEISNGIALFDTTINFILIDKLKLLSNGSGKGFVEFDVKNKFTTINYSNYKLEMIAQKGNYKIIVKVDSESKYTMKLKN